MACRSSTVGLKGTHVWLSRFSQGTGWEDQIMFPVLRPFLITLWVGCIALVVVTLGLVMGYFSGWTFVWAGVVGLVLGVPAGLLNWAWLRPNRSREIGWTWPIADWARRGFGLSR